MRFPAGSPTSATAPRLPGLRDLRVIGTGSFATVYRAIEDLTFREVAVKVLRPEIDPDLVERSFLNEAAVLGKIGTHPNVVDLFRADRSDAAQPFLVMRYVAGGDLQQLIRTNGPLSWSRVVRILRPILDALRFAHGRTVLHCDLKPANVLLTEEEVPVLVDFGVSRFIGATHRPATSLGAWSFTAPECLVGEAPTARSDLYSLGAIAHSMLTGRPPVDLGRSASAQQAATARRSAIVEPLPSELPTAAADLLRSMVAPAPEYRPASAEAALQHLAPHASAWATPTTQPAHDAPINPWWRQT